MTEGDIPPEVRRSVERWVGCVAGALSAAEFRRLLAYSLLSWRHSGFSVLARQHLRNEEPARLSHMARYLVRPPVAQDRVAETGDGRVLLRIPADPGTGEEVLFLDPLEWIHRITTQIPDARYHLVRYAGAYANRCRKQYRKEGHGVRVVPPAPGDPPLPTGKASWARLLRKVSEVDPLACQQCRPG